MIYLDNASTSFHKPDCVFTAVMEAMHQAGNSGRGSSGEAMEASRLIFDTRCRIAEMFEADGTECVAFTSNATEALNTALFGVLHPGDGFYIVFSNYPMEQLFHLLITLPAFSHNNPSF